MLSLSPDFVKGAVSEISASLRRALRVMAEKSEGLSEPGSDYAGDTAMYEFRPMFFAPEMVTQTGASLVKGGRRLSGRPCWNFTSKGHCAFGDACRFLHPSVSTTAECASTSQTENLLGYTTHKAQQQLGADPTRSLLAEVLENSKLFTRVKDPRKCALLWAQSFTTGTLYDNLPHGALVNHFPNTVAITHKHRLVLSLREQGERGAAVAPEGFLLPAESEAFREADVLCRDVKPLSEDKLNTNSTIKWIVKRSVGGEGAGIQVCLDAEAVLAYVAKDPLSKLAPTRLPVSGNENKSSEKNSSSGLEKPIGASHVVQRYIPRPLVVMGRKVDLRVYVLVTSWGDEISYGQLVTPSTGQSVDPELEKPKTKKSIRAYVYDEGLVRFAASEYDSEDLDPKRHLTNNALATGREHQGGNNDGSNSTIQVEGPDANAHFKRNWSFSRFGAWLDETNGEGSWKKVWESIRGTARVAVEAAQPAVGKGLAHVRYGRTHRQTKGTNRISDDSLFEENSATKKPSNKSRRHFELLGLDVLVDEDLRVWLLEVNSAPSLMAGTRHRGRVSETHHALKGGLIANALNLLDAARGVGEVEKNEAKYSDADEAAGELERSKRGRFVSLW